MPSDLQFHRVRTLNHNDTVMVFGESKGTSSNRKDRDHKLWYKVLDLEQIADQDSPNAWDDNTRWTDWMEVPYPDELRNVAQSLLTINQKVDDSVHDQLHHWRVISDESDLYLFRSIDLAAALKRTAEPALAADNTTEGGESPTTQIRIYGNRYTLQRDASPTGGTNRSADGKELIVPQLKLRSESRYRRSGLRETPESDLDAQGYIDMGDQLFREPTMEFSMLSPVDGLFAVTTAPSIIPKRQRWQFFLKEQDRKLAAFSLLRDPDGWFDAEEKFNQFNVSGNPFGFVPDQIFTVDHADYDQPLELIGPPDAIRFRSQEEASGITGNKEQMLSPERIMVSGRFKVGEEEHLVTIDFDFDMTGVADVPESVKIGNVNFARTALHLNGETDLVILPDTVAAIADTMTFTAWVRHNEGEGTLIKRGDPETEGFAIEWRPADNKLVALLSGSGSAPITAEPESSVSESSEANMGSDDSAAVDILESGDDPAESAIPTNGVITLEAPLPTSHTWHHIGLVVSAHRATLYIDGKEAVSSDQAPSGFAATGETVIGGPSLADPEKSWLDFEIDQVVLWQDIRPPSLENIYQELDAIELARPALLGCWQMDDAHDGNPTEAADSSSHGNNAQVIGADHVNQTAPIFKPAAGNFEDNLIGLSVGMGLIKFDDFALTDDPTLALSADGLIHLYTTADPIKGETAEGEPDNPLQAQPELVALQYDTTSTRVQINLAWEAVVERTQNKIDGDVILTAQTPGPIMNRTQVAMVAKGDKVDLTITNAPLGLVETWSGLPSKATDFVAIFNGGGSSNPKDEDVIKGDKLFYDYYANVRYNGEPLPGLVDAAGSPTFMAVMPVIPQNGGEAILQPTPNATLRQQGNFGGWVHAPVAISGRFDVREQGGAIAATVDLHQDNLMALSAPGDFGLEAWVKPDRVDLDDVAKSTVRDSRLMTLNGETDTAKYALGLRSAWSLSLSGSNHLAKLEEDGEPLLRSKANWRNDLDENGNPIKDQDGDNKKVPYNESFTIGLRINAPVTAADTGSLFQLISDEDGGHIFYSEIDLDGIWFKFIDENNQAQGIFAPFTVGPGESLFVSFVWDIVTETIDATDDTPKLRKNRDGYMRIFMNEDERASLIVDYAGYDEIEYLNLGAPDLDNDYTEEIQDRIDDLNEFLQEHPDPSDQERRTTTVGPYFYRGANVPIQEVRVWDFALTETDLSGILTVRFLRLWWKFAEVQAVSIPLEHAPQVGLVKNEGTYPDDADKRADWDVIVPTQLLRSGYEVVASAGKRQVVTNAQIAPDAWSHVAAVCTGNHALSFDPQIHQRAIVKDSGGLNASKGFTIDCTINWSGGDDDQYIISRTNADQTDMAFQLGVHADGTLFLVYIMLDAEGKEKSVEIASGSQIEKNVSYYIAARCELRDISFEDDPDEADTDRWQMWLSDSGVWCFDLDQGEWHGPQPSDIDPTREQMGWAEEHRDDINNNGRNNEINVFYVSRKNRTNGKIGLKQSGAMTSIGCMTAEGDTADGGPQGWYNGLIGNMRAWTVGLSAGAIKLMAVNSGVPFGVSKPAANWDFEENKGLIANDSTGGMTATLSDEAMWVTSRLTSQLSIYLDGRTASTRMTGSAMVEYGMADRLTFGALPDNDSFKYPLVGQMDDLRIWGELRSQEEIYDNRFVLLGGNENDLVGYWPISTASGSYVKDGSGRGNHATLNIATAEEIAAFWQPSTAPLGAELPQVRNILDGAKTRYLAYQATSSGAAEYGDMQMSADGLLQAFMKRVQVYLDDEGNCVTQTGYKVGDLDLVYIGQAQSDPTLIGYIEGAPPLPSENHTRPYYNSAYSYTSYYGASAVQLNEAENTTQIFDASSNRGFDQNWDLKAGWGIEQEIENGAALGAFFSYVLTKIKANIDAVATFSNNYDYLSKGGATIGTNRTMSNRLEAAGNWEARNDIFNDDLGRRWEFANVGYALVKSGVANVYSMKMRKTGTLMGVSMVPDPDIKEDYNIIMFEIEPTYTKQGTLDGKIGFMNDPDWPTADVERGSYFKPKEVNNLEKQIEAYEATLAANYADFNAGRLGRREQGLHFQKDDPANNADSLVENNITMPYDWDARVSRRNIVNTYVWTATGGMFTEEHQTSVVRTESSGGGYAFKGMAGVDAGATFYSGSVGVGFGLKFLLGGHINTTVMKTKQEGANFGLSVSANPEALLQKYTGNPNDLYTRDDHPGKVNGYRFKSFYLVPDKKHFQTFWDKVVSKEWLESNDPNAKALRAARGNQNIAWRVLHRVTYVSRVPPKGDTPISTGEKPTRAVIHQVPNWSIINLVLDVYRNEITSTGVDIGGLSQKERIGEAVADVIDNQWAFAVPWWQGYLDEAADHPGGKTFNELKEIKQAVYEYMLAYFETGEVFDDPRLITPPADPSGEGDGDGGHDENGTGNGGNDNTHGKPGSGKQTLEDVADRATHLYVFNEAARATDVKGACDMSLYDGAEVITESDIPGCQGYVRFPFDPPQARGEIGMTYDWGRDEDRTWEMVFRLKHSGRGPLISNAPDVPENQRFLDAIGFALPSNGHFYIKPTVADEPVILPGVRDSDVQEAIYLTISFAADEDHFTLNWRKESDTETKVTKIPVPEGRVAGGRVIFGGAGNELYSGRDRLCEIEIHHFATYSEILDDAAINEHLRVLKFD